MRILFITSAHNSLSQRLWIELSQRGHHIDLCLASSDQMMLAAVARSRPALIIAPMLKKAIPEAIWREHTCLIVHPGIVGDRGPSSLDWAIANDKKQWGVTILQAVEEMDAGPIWASHTFSLTRHASKSSLYHNEVTEAAVKGVSEAVEKFTAGEANPEPLDYSNPEVEGQLLPLMLQTDRQIDWEHDTTERITTKILAADSNPGVLDVIAGKEYYLYGAHSEERIKGAPGQLLAHRHGAILRGTTNGSVWVSHVKAKTDRYAGIKLPAYQVLKLNFPDIPEYSMAIDSPNDHATYREIRYREQGHVGYLSFDFYNGAMSTEQCRRLCEAYLFARFRPIRVLVLLGGYDYFSNGIHLNVIEAADNPADESWDNINAIDDLVYEVLTTQSQITIAALRGNAGAGGVMMALAADLVYAREGIVLNPHYKGMGGLYGSEYWTYSLPKRVGTEWAQELTEQCLPLGTQKALDIGLIDDCFGTTVDNFEQGVSQRAEQLAQQPEYWNFLLLKHQQLRQHERQKPLANYRAAELEQMWVNFYGLDTSYHEARQRFVRKTVGKPQTAGNITPLLAAKTTMQGKYSWGQRLRKIIGNRVA